MQRNAPRAQNTHSSPKRLLAPLVAALSTQCAAQTQLVIEVPSDIMPEVDLQALTIKVTRLDAMGQPLPIPITEQTVQIGQTATGGKKTIPVSLGVFAARGDDSRRVLVTVSGQRRSGTQAQTSAVVAFFPNKTVFYTLYLAGACAPAVNSACEAQGQACGMQGICVDRIRSTAQVLENGMRREVPVPSGTNGSDADVPSTDATMDAIDGTLRDIPTMDGMDAADVADSSVPEDRPNVVDVPANPALLAPRMIAPMSTSTVSSHRPTLRWENPEGVSGAMVTVCRDRAMTNRCDSYLQPNGNSLPISIPAGERGWFYWSVAGAAAGAVGNRSNIVWQFWVRTRDSVPMRDTVLPPPVDFNSDGFADIAVGANGANSFAGSVSVYRGSVMGPGALPEMISGPAPGAGFGISVAGAGDVNGDGYSDLIVGAFGANANAAFVYHGHGAGSLTMGSMLSAVGDDVLFGTSVSSAGDVNGDGFGDVIVGAPEGRMPGAAGSATVFLGGVNGVSPIPHRMLRGVMSNERFGNSVAGGGDLNGDGYGDVLIGAPQVEQPGLINAGAVSIYYGSSVGIAEGQAPQVFAGNSIGFLLGQSVAIVGDMNGDSLADAVAGAPTSFAHGEAQLFRGRSPRVLDAQRVSVTAASSDRFGTSVAGAGDVNNDGYADLIVGAPGSGLMAGGPGSAVVFLSNGVGYMEMQSSRVDGMFGGFFGNAVAGAGDIDGDGFGEVIVGEPEQNARRGQARVFLGMMTGINPANPVILNGGMQVQDQFGRSVAWLGLSTPRRRVWITQSL